MFLDSRNSVAAESKGSLLFSKMSELVHRPSYPVSLIM
jgi:hypothetical protein